MRNILGGDHKAVTLSRQNNYYSKGTVLALKSFIMSNILGGDHKAVKLLYQQNKKMLCKRLTMP